MPLHMVASRRLRNRKFNKEGQDNISKGNSAKERRGFTSTCLNCDKFGHMKTDCPETKGTGKDDVGTVFAARGVSDHDG